MISQVGNSASIAPGSGGQSAPAPVDIALQRPLVQVEMPHQAVQPAEKNVDIATVKNAAKQINEFVQQFDRNVQFIVDEETGIDVVQVVDAQSKEVIRQMPTDEMLKVAKAMDKLQGLLIREKA